jgi:hypothetical protein
MVRYKDADNNAFLLETTASLVANWSTTPVNFLPNPVQQRWEGNLDTSITGPGSFTVRINATQPYFETTYCYLTIRPIYNTRLSSPNAPWDTADWDSIKTVELHFERFNVTTQTWDGVTNTTPFVNVLCNWTAGYWIVRVTGVVGVYELDLNTTISSPGSWTLNLTATMWGHQTGGLALTLIVGGYPTELVVVGPSSIIVPVGISTEVTLQYINTSNGVPLVGATVRLVSITPATGLTNTSILDLGNGNYTLTLTPTLIESFTIIFQANQSSYQTTSVSLFLAATEIGTELDTGGVTSIPLTFGSTYNLSLFYIRNDSSAFIPSAVVDIVISPEGGPTWFKTELADRYNLTITPITTGTWILTITVSATNYEPQSIYIQVIVHTIDTNCDTESTTVELVYGEVYDISLFYTRNDTGAFIPGADIDLDTSPSTGLSAVDVELFDRYNITLTPTVVGAWVLTISVNLTNYQPHVLSIQVIVHSIETNLDTLGTTLLELIYGEIGTISLNYTRIDTGGFVPGADIEVDISPLGGLTTVDVELFDRYNVTIIPSLVGTWVLTIVVNATNYQPQAHSIQVIVRSIETNCDIEAVALELVYGETSTLYLNYTRYDTSGFISSASISIDFTPEPGILVTIEEEVDHYNIIILANHTGSWILTFTITRINHQSQIISLQVRINAIPTFLTSSEPPSEIYVGRHVCLRMNYTDAAGGLAGATLIVSGIASSEYTVIDHNNGTYTVVLTPDAIGSYRIQLRFSLQWYEEGVFVYYNINPLEVVRIPVLIQLIGGEHIDAVEGVEIELLIMLREADTNASILGAVIEYTITGQWTITGSMMDMEDGQYSAIIAPNLLPPEVYQVEIRVAQSQYCESQVFRTTLNVRVNTPARTAQISGIVILVILLLFATYISARQVRKRRTALLLKKLAVRQRFEDARNILSILVIHQTSGLPLFSTQLREDVPSELVAGFISAIRHFRKQFALQKEEILQVLPISDVIHISPTRNTLCGLVSLLPPSPALLERLEKYSIIINNEFDNLLDGSEGEPVSFGLPSHLVEALEECYDLRLLAPHIVSVGTSLPRRFRKLVQVCQERFGNQNVNLYELVLELVRMGEREENAYYLVLQALNAGYLVPHPRASQLDLVTERQTTPSALSQDSAQREVEGGNQGS